MSLYLKYAHKTDCWFIYVSLRESSNQKSSNTIFFAKTLILKTRYTIFTNFQLKVITGTHIPMYLRIKSMYGHDRYHIKHHHIQMLQIMLLLVISLIALSFYVKKKRSISKYLKSILNKIINSEKLVLYSKMSYWQYMIVQRFNYVILIK